jgi:LPS-assembly lipoprotein
VTALKNLLILLAMLLLGACGFQLRGTGSDADLTSISPLHVSGLGPTVPFYRMLRDYLRGANVEIAEEAKGAAETLTLFDFKRDRKIYSVGSRGRVLEYELIESVAFRLGRELQVDPADPARRVTVRRIYANPETETLGRQYEEATLWRDMEQQLAGLLMRRITAKVKRP